MNIGKINGIAISEGGELLAPSVKAFLEQQSISDNLISVAEIDPTLSDTTAFCEHYAVTPSQAANCVIIEAKRGETVTYAACVILAHTRADINGLVRRHLDARKAPFASMEKAVGMTGMEFGAITPIGLPPEWPILIDSRVIDTEAVIIGSGVRKSKLLVKGSVLKDLPQAVVLQELGLIKE